MFSKLMRKVEQLRLALLEHAGASNNEFEKQHFTHPDTCECKCIKC